MLDKTQGLLAHKLNILEQEAQDYKQLADRGLSAYNLLYAKKMQEFEVLFNFASEVGMEVSHAG